jgi:hypothetical protein
MLTEHGQKLHLTLSKDHPRGELPRIISPFTDDCNLLKSS